MRFRSFLPPTRSGIAFGLLISGLAISPGAAFAAEYDAHVPPNFLVIVSDDHRWDALGVMGNSFVHTPHLDRLARDGLLFSNSFCTTSICAIGRASLITGQYAARHGIVDFGTSLSPAALAETFPALLRQAGYRIGFVGKWGLGGPLPETEYDYWRGYPGQGLYFDQGEQEHLTDRLADQASEFLANCEPDRPFCLQLSFKAPHAQDGAARQFPPQAQYEELFRDVVIPPPPLANVPAYLALPSFLRESEGRRRWAGRFDTPEIFQSTVKDYYRLIAGLDEVVGRLRVQLESQGLADRTVIVFTSDNGYFLGDRGLADKWFMYDESIRVPLIVCNPRAALPSDSPPAPRMTPITALSIDLAPTILDLASLPIPATMQGRSLRPLVEGRSLEDRREWLYEHPFRHPLIPMSEGVRTPRWKYVRYVEREPVVEQLFDLKSDPHELNDLSTNAAHATTLEGLRARWQALRAEAGDRLETGNRRPE